MHHLRLSFYRADVPYIQSFGRRIGYPFEVVISNGRGLTARPGMTPVYDLLVMFPDQKTRTAFVNDSGWRTVYERAA